MRKDLKKKWIEALRSGRFKQGKNALKTNDKHCCLGVLCEVVITEAEYSDSYVIEQAKWGLNVCKVLPSAIRDYCGLESVDPCVLMIANGMEYVRNLSNLNDDGVSFTEIADRIEKSERI